MAIESFFQKLFKVIDVDTTKSLSLAFVIIALKVASLYLSATIFTLNKPITIK